MDKDKVVGQLNDLVNSIALQISDTLCSLVMKVKAGSKIGITTFSHKSIHL